MNPLTAPQAPRRGQVVSWHEEGRAQALFQGLVLSQDEFNNRTGTAVVAIVASETRHADNPFALALPPRAHAPRAFVLCHRIQTLDWLALQAQVDIESTPAHVLGDVLHRVDAILALRATH
jgi:mRNA-degrading endonuclease toxin of MazEF toxin-antitoxin module